MLKSKLWGQKIETKNEKVAKMVEFIKTCDQYPQNFNFGNFFIFIEKNEKNKNEKMYP